MWWTLPASVLAAEPPLVLSSVAVSPDGKWVAVGAEGVVVLYGAADLGERYRRTLDVGNVAVAFLPDGRLAASGTRTHRAVAWDPTTGAMLGEATEPFPCQDHWSARWDCEDGKGGRRVSFAGDYDRVLQVDGWDGATLTQLRQIVDPPGVDVARLALGAGGRLVVAGNGGVAVGTPAPLDGEHHRSPAGWVRVWRGGDVVCEQLALAGWLTAMDTTAEGVVVGDRDGRLTWLGPDCSIVAQRAAAAAAIVDLAAVPGTDRVVVVDASGQLAIETVAGRQLAVVVPVAP